MHIEIKDDFDLQKIKDSGQCFRIKLLDNGYYRFITGTNVVYIKPLGGYDFDVSCDEDTWGTVWVRYFDLDRNYSELRESFKGKHTYLDEAIEYSRGIRILRQNYFETLISFIISQRKNFSVRGRDSNRTPLCV